MSTSLTWPSHRLITIVGGMGGIPRALVRLGTRLGARRGYAAAAGAAENLEEWKARARQEAKGRDPWEAFATTNQDVSGRRRWQGGSGSGVGGGSVVAYAVFECPLEGS